MKRVSFAGLNAYVTGGEDNEGGGEGPVVILMHGFGAPGDDLVELGHVLAELPNRPRFVFPEAPLSLEGGLGRAWWMLDMEVFERRARGERIDRRGEIPPSLAAVRAQVSQLMAEVSQALSVSPSRMLLGGFSQGSMLACDVALHLAVKPGALLLLSSTLIAQPVWQPLMPSLKGVPVFQSHGRRDPILPFEDAQGLCALLCDAGAEHQFMEFTGGHEIPPDVLRGVARMIMKIQ